MHNDIHPMYTDKDEELAIKAITDYMTGNNVPEHYAFTSEPFKPNDFPIPEDVVSRDIRTVYGVNIIKIANFLEVQNIFFTKYMNHILRYLSDLGYECMISNFRSSDIIGPYIARKLLNNSNKDFNIWNPNIKWKDFNYDDDDNPENMLNPINIFYISNITILNPKKEFIDNFLEVSKKFVYEGSINRITEITRDPSNFDDAKSVTIKLLPDFNMDFLVEFVKQIHKYF